MNDRNRNTPITDSRGNPLPEDPAVSWLLGRAVDAWREYQRYKKANSPYHLHFKNFIELGKSEVVANSDPADWPGRDYIYHWRKPVVVAAKRLLRPRLQAMGDLPFSMLPPIKASQAVMRALAGPLSGGRARRRALAPEQVRFIRAEYDAGGTSVSQLASLFDVAPMVVYQIVKGLTYKDIT